MTPSPFDEYLGWLSRSYELGLSMALRKFRNEDNSTSSLLAVSNASKDGDAAPCFGEVKAAEVSSRPKAVVTS